MDKSDGSTGDPKKIKVFIVDDHPLFRRGLINILNLEDDMEVLGESADGEQGLDRILQLQPDIAVLDINMPGMNGLQVTHRLRADRTGVKVILLTAYDDQEQVLHAMRAGASAYCSKDVTPSKLVEIVRQVYEGHYVINEEIFDERGIQEWLDAGVEAATGPYMIDPGEHFVPLSPREMEILRYVTRGMSNKEIAYSLGISHQTVKNHMTSILRKLDVEDRTQAAVYALRRGWVRLQDTKPEEGDIDVEESDQVI
ncbi:MAG: response regulator transcription factor [Anaerolineae bacterium]|nr:response regulator transcription factor [Anaerolineae bacterium]